MKINIMHCTKRLLIYSFLSLQPFSIYAEDTLVSPTLSTPSREISGIEKEVNTIISAEQNPYLVRANFSRRAEELTALYKLSGNQLLWLGNEHSEKNINDAINLLSAASLYALKPENYDVDMLRQKRAIVLSSNPDAYLQRALYDTALSISLLRFAHDLHYGTIDPKAVGFNLKPRPKKLLDLPTLIKNSIASGTVSELPSHIEPKLKQYIKLKQLLITYTELAKSLQPIRLELKKKLHVGSENSQIPELQRFLVAVGDLPVEQSQVDLSTISLRYTDKIAEGVRKFQHRHGLAITGILDKNTADAINVPLNQRVDQIKLAMERLRWLPEFAPGQAIIVNIPAFQLWAFDHIEDEHPNVLNINVVVGKMPKNQTPVLMADMRFIDFAPYWNVPPTILKEEILPGILRDKKYLAKQDMEVVSNYGNPAKVVPLNATAIEKLKTGVFRVRQRPGKSNALGKIKFLFPNKADVYLHDTPAKALFKKIRRDFSHGCVRVENPERLAEFAFKNEKEWNKAAIQKAMKQPEMQEITLKKPIPVLLFYSTAFIDESDKLMFYADIYNRDQVLTDALKKPEDLSDQTLFAAPTEKMEKHPDTEPTIDSIDPRPSELMQ